MAGELMNTKEVARYLDIHEKQVYLLIKAGKIPCTKITGKWIFPVKLIDEWLQNSIEEGIRKTGKRISSVEGPLLASGSNDPVMDILLTTVKRYHPAFTIFSANTGSVSGLKALNAGRTDIAFSHLFDPRTGDYNIPFLKMYCPDHQPVVINLFHRRIGFLVGRWGKKNFHGWESLTDKRIRFVNRQNTSGIRIMLDEELKKRGVASGDIAGYDNEVYTHLEVGLSIVSDEADAGIASAAAAKIFDLKFLPLANERFDMVLDQKTFFEPAVQAFIETLRSNAFRKRVEKIGNYDFKDSGRILHSA
jgi:excisionase family DNA binding protein